MFEKLNAQNIPYPMIGDEILVGNDDRVIERLVVSNLPYDTGKFHHKDENDNDYFRVGVLGEEGVQFYSVRYDTLLQDWTQVGLTLDYEED